MDAENRFYMNLGRRVAEIAEEKATGPSDTKFDLDMVRQLEAGWRELDWKCESPIEKLLAAELMFISDGYNDVEHDWTSGGVVPEFRTVVDNQVPIGTHRVDFLFTLHCKGKKDMLVVETDGHDFHEKTKEQARRDKSRDRKIVAAGYTVLRFTGSEVFREPSACAEEIADLLADKMMFLLEGRRPRGR